MKLSGRLDMKLIPSERIPGDIHSAVSKLRKKGILASSTSDYANIPRYGSAAKQIKEGVWIHLNHQYADAVNLLRDPGHKVKTALTPEEMTRIELNARSVFFVASERFFRRLGVGLVYLAIFFMIFFFVLKLIFT